jgi:hypothetical protein
MQQRYNTFKTYKQFISCCRSLRDLIAPHDHSGPTQTSPFLVFTATVLGLLLTILEIDIHSVNLRWLGLMASQDLVDPMLLGP